MRWQSLGAAQRIVGFAGSAAAGLPVQRPRTLFCTARSLCDTERGAWLSLLPCLGLAVNTDTDTDPDPDPDPDADTQT